jgi:3',5'-cyclic-AMP phosphodiesterase
MTGYIDHEHESDGIDRKGFLKCMAWAGTGVVWTLTGCGFSSRTIADTATAKATRGLSFVQISDSHVGFDKAANKGVISTLEQCVARINALARRPAFVIHTGDHVHLSTPSEFDTVKHILSTIKTDRVFHVPGEHDVFVDQGRLYRKFFGRGSHGTGYYSFDRDGVHFLALIAFIKKDLAKLPADTPIVIFGHVPLLAVYPQWGWATADSAQVLKLLKRFASVTALNGHIHQVISKTEGNIVMHTARSTAYPLHPPGNVAPEPLVVPAGELPSRIGIRTVGFRRGSGSLALVDESLAR